MIHNYPLSIGVPSVSIILGGFRVLIQAMPSRNPRRRRSERSLADEKYDSTVLRVRREVVIDIVSPCFTPEFHVYMFMQRLISLSMFRKGSTCSTWNSKRFWCRCLRLGFTSLLRSGGCPQLLEVESRLNSSNSCWICLSFLYDLKLCWFTWPLTERLDFCQLTTVWNSESSQQLDGEVRMNNIKAHISGIPISYNSLHRMLRRSLPTAQAVHWATWPGTGVAGAKGWKMGIDGTWGEDWWKLIENWGRGLP